FSPSCMTLIHHLPTAAYQHVTAGACDLSAQYDGPDHATTKETPMRPYLRAQRMTASVVAALAVVTLAACSSPPAAFHYQVPQQPEGSSGYTEKPGWATERFAVAA